MNGEICILLVPSKVHCFYYERSYYIIWWYAYINYCILSQVRGRSGRTVLPVQVSQALKAQTRPSIGKIAKVQAQNRSQLAKQKSKLLRERSKRILEKKGTAKEVCYILLLSSIKWYSGFKSAIWVLFSKSRFSFKKIGSFAPGLNFLEFFAIF